MSVSLSRPSAIAPVTFYPSIQKVQPMSAELVVPDMTPAARSRKPRPWLAPASQETVSPVTTPSTQLAATTHPTATMKTRPNIEFPLIPAASASNTQEKGHANPLHLNKPISNPSTHQPPRPTIHAPPMTISNPMTSSKTDLSVVWQDKAIAQVKVRFISLFNTLHVTCAAPIHIVGEFMLTMLSLFFWSHPPLHPFVERTVFDSGFHYLLAMPFLLAAGLTLFSNSPSLDWLLNVVGSIALIITLPLLAWFSRQNGALATIGFSAWTVSASFVTLYWFNLTLVRTSLMIFILVLIMVGSAFAWMHRLHTICFLADNFFDIPQGTVLQPRPAGVSMEDYMASLGIANRHVRRHWTLAHQRLYILCRTGLFNHNSAGVTLLPSASPASVALKNTSHSHVEAFIVSAIVSLIMFVEHVMDGPKMKTAARLVGLASHIWGTFLLSVSSKDTDTNDKKGHFVLTSLPKSIINDGFGHWTSVTHTTVIPPTPTAAPSILTQQPQQMVGPTIPAPSSMNMSRGSNSRSAEPVLPSVSRKRKSKPSRQHDSAHFIEQ